MCDSLFRHLDRHWNLVVPDCLFTGLRVPVSSTVSSVPPDHHQSAAAVLCPAGQELPVLLREGEDSECCVAPRLPPSLSAPRRFTALWTLPSLWSRWIFNLPLLPTFRLLPLVVFLISFHLLLRWLLFLTLGVFFALSRLSWLPHLTLLSLSPAVRADEQHPADEGPVGEDVWINGSQTGEMQQSDSRTTAGFGWVSWSSGNCAASCVESFGPLKCFSLLLLLLRLFHTHRVK